MRIDGTRTWVIKSKRAGTFVSKDTKIGWGSIGEARRFTDEELSIARNIVRKLAPDARLISLVFNRRPVKR